MAEYGFPKPSRTARKKANTKKKVEIRKYETDNKAAVRRREGFKCRFPLCGCAKFKLRLECSHNEHKKMGGDKVGNRSETSNMALLCEHRHQTGIFSRHAGTLMVRFLTARGFDGPVIWLIDKQLYDRHAMNRSGVSNAEWYITDDGTHCYVVCTEGVPLSGVQTDMLNALGCMEL